MNRSEQRFIMSTLLPRYTKYWQNVSRPPYRYTLNQKLEAVALAENFGFKITCKALEISSNSLSKWIKSYRF